MASSRLYYKGLAKECLSKGVNERQVCQEKGRLDAKHSMKRKPATTMTSEKEGKILEENQETTEGITVQANRKQGKASRQGGVRYGVVWLK